jgi:hypothetical protein
VLSPTSVVLTGVGTTQNVTVSQTGYTGTLSQTNTCGGTTPIATFSASSGSGPSWNLVVTAASGGTCSATFNGGSGQSTNATISVTTSGIIINTTKRRP